jgi:acyl dehydratase
MQLDPGTPVDEVQIDIERGKIREFARATHAVDPVHTDPVLARAAGHRDVLATATHVVVTGHQRDQAAFVAALGLDIARIVVGSVSWEYLRPLLAGDLLTATRTVVADESKPGRTGGTNRLVTLETAYVDAAGQIAVRQREVLIERGTA